MSHYQVCVAIPANKLSSTGITNWSIENVLDEILAPYDEASTEARYLEFEDRTVDALADYESDTVTAVKFPDGSIHRTSDPLFAERFVVKDNQVLEKINGEYTKAKETKDSRPFELVRDYPVKSVYSFEEYCNEYCQYAEDSGRWGYWSNPEARWDYFCIGGRFSGSLLVKEGTQDCLAPTEDENSPQGFQLVDGARKGDIAWAERRDFAKKAYEAGYEKLKEAFQSKDVKALGPFTSFRDDGIYGWTDLLYKKNETCEEYMRRNGFHEDDLYRLECYAFVDLNGEWHSQGEMGWFGLSANDKESGAWHREVQNFLKGVDDNDFIVMVDCHI